MKKLNKRKTRLLRVMSLGLIAVVFSVSAIAGVNAKYKTETTATATAEVAKFSIGNTMTDLEIEFRTLNLNFYDPAKASDTLDFAVYSESEVAVKYSVVVTTSATVSKSAWLDLSLGTEIPDKVETNIISGKVVYTFSDVGTFSPCVSDPLSQSLQLNFTINEIYLGNQEILGSNPDLTFTVTVKAEQLD